MKGWKPGKHGERHINCKLHRLHPVHWLQLPAVTWKPGSQAVQTVKSLAYSTQFDSPLLEQDPLAKLYEGAQFWQFYEFEHWVQFPIH